MFKTIYKVAGPQRSNVHLMPLVLETLVAELYRENDFNFLLQESPEAVQAREKAKSQLAAAAQAQTILNNSLREIERAT